MWSGGDKKDARVKIGEAAGRSGISAKMIRYYEATGLITPAGRSSSNYRDYSPKEVHELRFIRRARDLGFSVADIGELLDLWRDGDRESGEVKKFVHHHIVRLREKVNQLEAMVSTLESLAEQCAGNDRPECPIIDRLEGVSVPRSRSEHAQNNG